MNKKAQMQDGATILLFVIGAILLISLLLSVYTVSAGHRGVIMTMGKVSMDSMEEGVHLKIPFIQSVKKFEVKTLKIEVDADASSKDLQNVQTVIALNYHLQPDSVPRLYQEIGSDYKSRIIDPAIQEAVKSVQARYTAEELITKRPEVRKGIQDYLSEKLTKSYIKVDDFNIINFQFSDEFDSAIEEKVTAEQKKLKAEMDLERIAIEAQQQIVSGEAEARILELQKQQITHDLIELRKIEVQSKALDVQATAIQQWNGILPVVSGGSTPFISFDSLPTQGPTEVVTD